MFGDPLQWLRENYARITNLPARLTATIERAHALLSDSRLSYAERQRAGRIWADASADRAEVVRLLDRHIQSVHASEGGGLSAWPLLIVVGISAAAAAATFVAIFGRESAYERELDAIESGYATPEDIARLRDTAPVSGGVAASLHEASKLLTLALVGYGAIWLARRYAR